LSPKAESEPCALTAESSFRTQQSMNSWAATAG